VIQGADNLVKTNKLFLFSVDRLLCIDHHTNVSATLKNIHMQRELNLTGLQSRRESLYKQAEMWT